MNLSTSYSGLKKIMHRILECGWNEKWLDEQEIISLVFLLCDDPFKAHCILTRNIVNYWRPDNILPELFEYFAHSGDQNIDNKIVESLILIGNYRIVRLLGYNKQKIDALKEMYRKAKCQHYINTVRKVLLRICENMSDDELVQLIGLIESDLSRHNSQLKHYDSKQMEMNLLFCICQNYISDGIGKKCEVSNLVRLLKRMEKHDLAEQLDHAEKIVMNGEVSTTLQKDNGCMENIVGIRNTSVIHNDDHYKMDKDNMGLCIIVNQRNFSKNELRSKDSTVLGVRHGTEKDRDMLRITFTGFGYNVIVLENLDSATMEKSIRGYVKLDVLERHSSLVLCVLSHGKRGAVYCVDGCEVPVEKIEKWIMGEECPQLLSKPKLLIIQACQGNDLQKAVPHVQDMSMFECDGPSYQHVPPTADLFTFWATVEGYASFRHSYSGSVFIQTLCSQLLKRGHRDHLGDIATYVNDVLSKTLVDWDNKVTMSQVKHTTRKMLYFPYCPNARARAAKLLFEKYLIEALILHCILKEAAFTYWYTNGKPSI